MTFVLHTRAWLFPLGASDGKGDKQTVYGLLQAAGFHPHTSDGKTESLIMAVERNRRPFYVMVNFSSEGSSCSGTSPVTSQPTTVHWFGFVQNPSDGSVEAGDKVYHERLLRTLLRGVFAISKMEDVQKVARFTPDMIRHRVQDTKTK
jgi:acylphosphatase